MLPPLPKRQRAVNRGEGWLNDLSVTVENRKGSRIIRWIGRRLIRLTLYFGRTFPYIYRPWYWLARSTRQRLDQRRYQSAGSIWLRRLCAIQWPDKRFRTSYAIVNWLTVLFCLPLVDDVLAGVYAYTTYPFGTYRDVVVTQAYRNITETNTYSVHGYQIEPDGQHRELYFEIIPNIWFWQFYPEFTFGQVPVLGRCTFDTYGITLRIPRRLRLFTAGSIYALNPYIVNMHCRSPTVVPDRS